MLTKVEIIEKINNVITDQFGIEAEELDDSTSFVGDLHADSLDLVELIIETEDRCGISIQDSDAEKLVTRGKLTEFIFEHQPRE